MLRIGGEYDCAFGDREYAFSPILGALIEKPISKVSNGLKLVNDPFLLTPRTPQTSYKAPKISGLVKLYAKTLTILSRHSFQLAFTLSKLAIPIYKDATDAILAYRKLYPGEQQRKLCLPRMLFAASLSKKFKKNGVAFIGAFLPSVQMHAWVIEDNMVADPFDNQWICYKPVLVIK